MTEDKIDTYIRMFADKLKETLRNKNFIGNVNTKVNIKEGTIANMNLSAEESIRIA